MGLHNPSESQTTSNELQTVLNNILTDKNTNLKPENLKKDVTCLGVTGTLEASTTSGGVKQFSTVEEMNASTGNTEGDLAIVYRNEVQNATVDSKFQVATFPNTVVLDSAITDYVEVRYRAVDSSKMFDCMGQLDSSRFMMDCYTESGEIRIQYESSDGITYTRTDTTGNPVDFGTEIYYEYAEMWNDVIGKFIQIGGSTFEGLYEYNDSSWVLAPTQLSAIADYVYGEEFYGKNGLEVGTLQNIENLSKDNINTRVKLWNIFNSGMVCPSDVSNMFKNCTNLQTIPQLNTSSVTNMGAMFSGCTNLTTIPLLNTSSVTSMNYMFNNCQNLTTVPLLDTSSVTNMQDMFYNCMGLSDDSLNNILTMCTNATSYTGTKTLKYIGLASALATKCTTLSNYSAFTSAGWTTGY